jgi:hypothetical protein
MTWGRQAMSGGDKVNGGANGNGTGSETKVVNVLATGSVDQTVKVCPKRWRSE